MLPSLMIHMYTFSLLRFRSWNVRNEEGACQNGRAAGVSEGGDPHLLLVQPS